MSVFETISWVFPWAFLVLPLPVFVYFFAPAAPIVRSRALRIPDADFYKAYAGEHQVASAKYWLRIVLLTVAWVALVASVARPQNFSESLSVPVTGRDLLLGIDISGSMRETDLYSGNRPATRMAVVKQLAQDFVERRGGDRIGLIMFGSQAYVQTPLTYDHETVQHFLSEATIGLAGRSTAIGDAIGLGVKRLRERPDASRVLILLTDGANSAGVVDPLEAAQVAASSDIRIHTIGVGSDQGANVFGRAMGTRRSELDEATLQAISDATGGQYFRARSSQELASIYATIDELEPTEQDEQQFRPLNELFAWPLSIALLCSFLWALSGMALVSSAQPKRPVENHPA